MVTDALKAGQMDELDRRVLQIVARVERIETPRGFRLWKIIGLSNGDVVPVFVLVKPRLGAMRRARQGTRTVKVL